MIERIAILGTGLLGTSVGLALRASGYRGSIVGWNRGEEGARLALEAGAIDAIAADPIAAAREAEVTLLAVPIYATLDLMKQLTLHLGGDQLVTDVGSTKARITQLGMEHYNQMGCASFLPGHPMAGKERGGAALGDADLFRDRVWLFTDGPGCVRSKRALELIAVWRKLVAAMGSKCIDIDPMRHDEMVAWVSHLPQFLATALSALLQEKVGDAPELKDVGGRALSEMTRLGASPYTMWRDIAATNTEAVAAAIFALEQRLAHLRENLKTPELRDEFEQANRFRRE
jgi:prephenate dehydrogenase